MSNEKREAISREVGVVSDDLIASATHQQEEEEEGNTGSVLSVELHPTQDGVRIIFQETLKEMMGNDLVNAMDNFFEEERLNVIDNAACAVACTHCGLYPWLVSLSVRPIDHSTTSNDAGQLGSPGIPPDQNDHKEDPPVVTTDDTINTVDLLDSNNVQDTQPGTIATVTNQLSNSEDDHNDNIKADSPEKNPVESSSPQPTDSHENDIMSLKENRMWDDYSAPTPRNDRVFRVVGVLVKRDVTPWKELY